MADQNNTLVQFSLGSSSTKLNLNRLQLQNSPGHASNLGLLAPAALGACSFTTRTSAVGVRKLASHKVQLKSRASPFASISMALPLASVTASKGKAPAAAPAEKKKKSLSEIMEYAGKKALSGGIPGMVAMALQVLSLMWLRTTMNYQYRYGTSTMNAIKTLYAEGGIPRFYQGLLPALIQGPLSRFGDTAANTGVLAVLEDVDIPPALKTVAASLGAGLFRIFLMPVDAVKTIMQVEGKNGMAALANKIKAGGPTVLYHGALAASVATFVGHYPWFAMYNTLNEALPKYDELKKRLLRAAFIGWCSSFVSDVCSNSIRVVKTARQTATTSMSYPQVVKMIVEKDGVSGLFLRGLGTKLITNGLQGILFSVLWRLGQDYMAKQEAEKKKAEEDAAKAAAQTASGKKKK
mmetsp:Transcript_28270/g.62071  ORF Transcript_28270/g.62071 Transcript_28270/m.62071 type:complete len:408 (-) Transcript_28270:816-2039(-)|eukprot:CAMPEP_0202902080 /NCGR_PEP_ID=MMETSP1392-20130828/16194_1 /ASSEMBLY_ACC=CAM_ASM_000868 /TAXON_ID=225041 /ORGANISM="Chlamydomonas chlamydogama, Strain SAG 11-48b" /LENGTH=407 /DNA_ID=CAMNT_0049588771 /DNA_START=102 /DNA_END=1325 /DNA_ORIENTATION=-